MFYAVSYANHTVAGLLFAKGAQIHSSRGPCSMLNILWGEMRPSEAITDSDIDNTFSVLVAHGADLRTVSGENWERYAPALFYNLAKEIALM